MATIGLDATYAVDRQPSGVAVYSRKLIEALATGKPVLATNCGGPQSIVNETVGVLVQPGSSEELVKGIRNMLSRLDQYNSDEIRQYAVDRYSGQAISVMLKEIYSQVLKLPISNETRRKEL